MTHIDLKNREPIHSKFAEIQKIKLGVEVPLIQIFRAIQFKVKWFLTKKFCHVLQEIFPEFNHHHRLLNVVLVELEDMENLQVV
jgi:hypothetical protein